MGALRCRLDLYHPVCSLTIAFAADYRDDGPSIQAVGLPNLRRAYGCDFGYSVLFPRLLVFSSRLRVLPPSIRDYDRRISSLPVPHSTSQTCTVKSVLPEAIRVLSGDHASAVKMLVWP
jgi:hypothetical protein